MENDPIQKVEKVFREIHDKSGKHIQPVLRRYPLLFIFLTVFSVSAIMHGFNRFSDQIGLFSEHPIYLILSGILVLFFTGMLYKVLDRTE